jgi:hypothetical protein
MSKTYDKAWKRLIGFNNIEGDSVLVKDIPISLVKILSEGDRIRSPTNIDIDRICDKFKSGFTFIGELDSEDLNIDGITIPKKSKINVTNLAWLVMTYPFSEMVKNDDGSITLIWG